MRHSIPVLLFLTAAVLGDSCTVFETPFAALPDGWSNDEWNFNSNDGAWISGWVTGWPSFYATMGSDESYQGWYFVPDGTDSLKIHIEHELNAINNGYCQAGIELLIPGYDDVYLFGPSVPWGMYETSDPIDTTLHTPPAGGWIGFNIHACIDSIYPGTSDLSWYITFLSVTAYGEELELDASTWAEIKQIGR